MNKIKIDVEEMLKTVAKVEPIANGGITLTFRMQKDAKNAVATAVGYDGQSTRISAVFACQNKLEQDLSVVMDNRLFFSAVKALSKMGDTITLTEKDGSVTLSCGTSKVPMKVKEDMATLADPDADEPFIMAQLDRDSFTNIVNKTAYVHGTEKMDILCLLPDIKAETLSMVATDAHAAAVAESKIKVMKNTFEKDIPRIFCVNASRFLELPSKISAETVNICFYANKVIILTQKEAFIVKTVDAAYKADDISDRIRKIISEEIFSFKVNVKELSNAVDVALLDTASLDSLKNYYSFELSEDGKLTISAPNGENSSVISLKEFSGKSGMVTLHSSYVKRIIARVGDEVYISGKNGLSPVSVKGSDDSFLSMICPCDTRKAVQAGEEK